MLKKTVLSLFALIIVGTTTSTDVLAQTADCLLPTSSISIVTCSGLTSASDVVVTSFIYNQTTKTFVAIVKNQGAVSTPADKVIGVGYYVDGAQKTWGKVNGPLAPGASVVVGTDMSDPKAGPYTIPTGTHTIKAWVDDVNRFAETNEANNQLTQSITIGGTPTSLPDVVVTDLSYNQITHTFTATVRNQGTVATPTDVVIGVGYFVNNNQKTWGKVNGPLAPGASVTVGTNLTGIGAGPYTIPTGTHTIKAWVDDVNRFAETNEANNQLTQSIIIGGGTGANVPPTISGSPLTSVVKSTAYNFIPTASDANGDVLTFAIQNKPAWATFNTSTGRLSGTPTVAGTHSNIRISVTDNKSTPVWLPAFTITVTNTLPPVAGAKYNPGHYVTLSHSQSTMLDDSPSKSDDGPAFAQKLKDDGVKGVVVRYPWKQVETSHGVYNYTRINNHLNTLNAKGLKMVVFIDDKSFSGSATVPDYIKNNSNYVFANKTGGVSATRWNPFVKQRFIAMWTDMGEHIDNHPALEGVVYSETSLSMPPGAVTVPAYDPVLNKQVIIETLTAQSAAFPKSNVFWMVNYFPNGYHDGVFQGNAIVDTYVGDIADAVLSLGVIMGGPDILPEDSSLVNRMYPYYDEFNAKGMKLFCSAQNDSYRHMHDGNTKLPFYTPTQIFNYGKNELHVNYIWWNYKTWVSETGELNKEGVVIPPGEYKWNDAVPVIKSNPVINAS